MFSCGFGMSNLRQCKKASMRNGSRSESVMKTKRREGRGNEWNMASLVGLRAVLLRKNVMMC